jgi:hypothetical protein
MTDFRKMSDDELAQAADAGLRGSGAIIEMQRRLKNSNSLLTKANVVLAFVGVLLAGVQVWLARHPAQQALAPTAISAMPSAPISSQPPVADPAGIFGDNKPLHDCLVNANPKDPLGIISETQEQARKHEECIKKYGAH